MKIKVSKLKARYIIVPKTGRQMIAHSEELRIGRQLFVFPRGSGRSSISMQQQINNIRMLSNAGDWDINLQLKHEAEQLAKRRKFLGGR